MTSDEAKVALRDRTPVVCGGIEYKYISAIIYRYNDKGQFLISAELLDKRKNSVTVARMEDVKLKKESSK